MPDEYISREAMLEHLDRCKQSEDATTLTDAVITALQCFVQSQPTADVAEVKYGKWAVHYTAAGNPYTECTHCCTDFTFKTDKGTFAKLDMRGMPYCPHCGARMDGGCER